MSDLGERFWRRVNRRAANECWPWTAARDSDGYGCVWWGGRPVGAHRVAFLLTHGRWPEPCGLHTCDNPPCCNPAHVYEGTQARNVADREARKRHPHPRGERHSSAVLTDARVAEMRSRHAAGETNLAALAREFGIGRTQVRRIIHKEQRANG